jgi:hypothetical protein
MNGFEFAGHRLAVGKTIVGGPLIDGMDTCKVTVKERTCVVIKNLCEPSEIATETQRAELLADCLAECKKYGNIVSEQLLVVPQDNVHLYLQYDAEANVDRAISALDGRWFGGRQLRVEVYSVDRYLMRDFE